jgi:photosystem II stability/assembly factor-like uncharacterized protein
MNAIQARNEDLVIDIHVAALNRQRSRVYRWQPSLFLIFFVLSFSGRAQDLETMHWITPRPNGNDLNRIIFTDNKNGWIVGNQGTILHSSDGGFVWTQVPSGTTDHLNGITFVSHEKGWIVGDDGALLVTTNSGKSWDQLPSPGMSALNDVAFLDQNIGVAVGDSGIILRTTDGGTHWESLRRGDPRNYTRIVLDSQRDGIITGSDGTVYRVERFGPIVAAGDFYDKPWVDASASRVGNQFVVLSADGCIFSSSNRRDWSRADALQDQVGADTKFTCLVSLDENSVLVGTTAGSLWVSLDKLKRWRQIAPSEKLFPLQSFACRDDTTFFGVGKGGEVIRLDGRELTISPVTKHALPSISAAAFLDEDNALALTTNKQLLMTTDGGSTWRQEGESSAIINSLFRSIQFVSQETGFALTSEGVLRTSDAGQSWRLIPFTLGFQPKTMGSFGKGEVWFSGDGYTAVTDRSGESLLIFLDSRESEITKLSSLVPSAVLATLPFSDHVLSISKVGALEWVIMTSHKWIYRTSDHGEHWESLGKPSIDPVVALSIPGFPVLLLEKDAHGQVYVGGSRFVSIELPQESSFSINDLIHQGGGAITSTSDRLAPISGAWVFPESMVWIACGNGLALKSLDGGRSWMRVRFPMAGEITSISFPGVSGGWCSTSEGNLFLTKDGGTTWQLLSSRTPGRIVSMQMISDLRGWAVNDNGDLLFTLDGGVSWMRKIVSVTEGVSDLTSDPSGSAWIALGRSLLEVQSPLGSRVRRYSLPLAARIRKLGIASDSSILFVSDAGEVGSIRSEGSEPVILATKLPSGSVVSISGPDGLRPIVLTGESTHYRWNQPGTWEAFSFPSGRAAKSIGFVNKKRGIVAGAQGMIYITDDGGTNWSEAPRATYSQLLAVASSQAHDLVWVGGDEGAVLVSHGDDNDYRRILLPFNDRIIHIQFLPPDLLFLASQGGSLVRVNTSDVLMEER